jgi:hypothetical protein
VHNALRRQVQQPVRNLQVDVVEMRPDIRRRLSCERIISKTEENTPQVNQDLVHSWLLKLVNGRWSSGFTPTGPQNNKDTQATVKRRGAQVTNNNNSNEDIQVSKGLRLSEWHSHPP